MEDVAMSDQDDEGAKAIAKFRGFLQNLDGFLKSTHASLGMTATGLHGVDTFMSQLQMGWRSDPAQIPERREELRGAITSLEQLREDVGPLRESLAVVSRAFDAAGQA